MGTAARSAAAPAPVIGDMMLWHGGCPGARAQRLARRPLRDATRVPAGHLPAAAPAALAVGRHSHQEGEDGHQEGENGAPRSATTPAGAARVSMTPPADASRPTATACSTPERVLEAVVPARRDGGSVSTERRVRPGATGWEPGDRPPLRWNGPNRLGCRSWRASSVTPRPPSCPPPVSVSSSFGSHRSVIPAATAPADTARRGLVPGPW